MIVFFRPIRKILPFMDSKEKRRKGDYIAALL